MATSQVDRVREEIKGRILEGAYAPGSPLLERVLCEVHETSRTTVREALYRLQVEGLVERVSGRGSFVARPSLKDLKEIFQMRELIEGEAAYRAARSATPQELAAMRASADFEYEPGDRRSYLAAQEHNARFHRLVTEASHNELLVEFMRICMQRMEHFMLLGGHTAQEYKDSHAEHHRVVDALEAGDGDTAREILRNHMRRTKELMMHSLLELSGSVMG